MKKVTVIMPTFKRPEMLERALDSIFSQTYRNIEIIVIDDNGENNDYDSFYFEIEKKYPIVYVKNKKNIGAALSRNVGIKLASGYYLTFLDDDDTYDKYKIEYQVQLIENSSLDDVGFVYCQMTRLDKKMINKINVTKNFYRGNKTPFENNLKSCIAGTPTILVKTSLIRKIKGFREISSGQDWCLILDLLATGCNVDYNKESLVNVCIHEGARVSTSHNKIESLLGEVLSIKKEFLKEYDKEFQNEVFFYHYYQLASALKYSDKLASFLYFRKSLSFGFHLKPTLKYTLSFTLGDKVSNYLSNKFKI